MGSKQRTPPDRQGDLALSGFLASAIVAALLVAGTYWMAARQAATQEAISQTHEVLAALASARADALAGRAAEGERPEDALRRLRLLTRDNPVQQAQLDRVEQALATEPRRSHLPALGATLQRMETEERRLLAQRLQAQQRGLDAFSTGMAVLFVALLAALVFLYQQIRRKRDADLRLLEGEQQFHAMTDSVSDHAILMLDAQGNVRTWNPGARRIFGYEAGDILGHPYTRFYPPEELAAGVPARALAAADGAGQHVGEGWRMRKDGSRLWASSTLAPLRDEQGRLTGFCKITRDLSDRKAAEEQLQGQVQERERMGAELLQLNMRLEALVAERTLELQQSNRELRGAKERLQALSARLISAQEEERRHVARELHDETGQALTLIRMQLAELLAAAPPDQQPLHECMACVDRAIAHIRGLSLRLRPPMLDDLGLGEALEWAVETQARAAGWRPHVAVPTLQERLPGEMETACFRICQEALTNAARYARASDVSVSLQVTPDQVRLEVADNGAGFDLARYRTPQERKQHFGLVSMSERAALAGGRLEIETAPGNGTCVRAIFPLAANGEEAPVSAPGALFA